MKRLELTSVEMRTLRDREIFHSHPRTRLRAQAIVRLSQGLTLQGSNGMDALFQMGSNVPTLGVVSPLN